MSDKYLLDTNAVIALLRGDEAIARIMSDKSGIIPLNVAAELFYGAEKSSRKAENYKKYEDFIAERQVLECDIETARFYGRIAYELQKKGRRIPVNDMWIAALAMQYDLTVLTRDKHFDNVDNLKKLAW